MPPDTYWCPSCGKMNASLRARLIIVAMVAGVLIGIGVTSRYVTYLKDFEAALGHRWFVRGEDAMKAKETSAAIQDYRDALGYEGSNRLYRQRLAEALIAQGQLAEARSYLAGLWTQGPADGDVNLDLARLYVREDKPESAIRHYRMAVDGVWENDPLEHRLNTRLELVRYLIQEGEPSRATAELIAVQAEAPEDPQMQAALGKLLLQLGDYSRAGRAFELVLKQQPQNVEAWSGAGEAALAAGDYRKSVRLLTMAANLNSAAPGSPVAEQLALAKAVVEADPSLRTLSMAERSSRIASGFDSAMERLQVCSAKQGIQLSAPTSDAAKADPAQSGQKILSAADHSPAPAPDSLQLLYQSGMQRRAEASAAALRKNPDTMAATMQFVYQVFRTTESACPAESLRDKALLLLARHEAEELR